MQQATTPAAYFEAEDGWHGETVVPLPSLENRFLWVHTHGQYPDLRWGNNLVVTRASVMQAANGGFVTKWFEDFNQVVLQTQHECVNEKLVRQQHERALTMLDDIVRNATAFYLPQAAKAA